MPEKEENVVPKHPAREAPPFLQNINEGDIPTTLILVRAVLPPTTCSLRLALNPAFKDPIRKIVEKHNLWGYFKCILRALINTAEIDLTLGDGTLCVRNTDGTYTDVKYVLRGGELK